MPTYVGHVWNLNLVTKEVGNGILIYVYVRRKFDHRLLQLGLLDCFLGCLLFVVRDC